MMGEGRDQGTAKVEGNTGRGEWRVDSEKVSREADERETGQVRNGPDRAPETTTTKSTTAETREMGKVREVR